MSKHEVLGELDAEKLAILRMTLVAADTAEGWFTARDVALPLSQVTTEWTIRELYRTMVRHSFMEQQEQDGTQMYRLSQRGINVLGALLRP